MVIVINTNKKSSDMNSAVQIHNDANKVIRDTHFGSNIKTRLGGMPAIIGQARGEVIKSMAIMLVLAIVLMVIILGVIFPGNIGPKNH